MNILYLTEYYPPHIGGQEFLFEKIVAGVSSPNIQCTVITSRTEENSPKYEKSKNKIIYRLNIPKLFFRFFYAVLSVSYALKFKNRIDFLHGSTYGGALPAFVLSMLLRKPAILTVHEFMGKKWFDYEQNYFTASFYYLSELLIAKMPFRKFIAVSKYTKSKLIEAGVNKNKIEVIYNGDNEDIIFENFKKDKHRMKYGYLPDDFIFLGYGRAGITKGFEYFVDAIPKIYEKIEKAKFILILNKADKKIWDKIINSITKIASDRLYFHKQVKRSQLAEFLAISDCVVIPSLSEGFGFTTREASISGKKIVATKVGSISEVISGNYLLIKPKSVDSIVKGCINIFNNNFKKKEPKIFNWNDTIINYKIIYYDLTQIHKTNLYNLE